MVCHFQRTCIYPRKAENSLSLKRTWFFVCWLAKHIRNPIRIDLNRRTGRTWTVDSFLSSRMHWSSFTSLFGVKIPQSPHKYLRLQHLNPGIRRTWDSDCFLSLRLPWSSFFLCLSWRFHKVHGSSSIQNTEMVKSMEDLYILLHSTNCDIHVGVNFRLCFLYWSPSLVVFS